MFITPFGCGSSPRRLYNIDKEPVFYCRILLHRHFVNTYSTQNYFLTTARAPNPITANAATARTIQSHSLLPLCEVASPTAAS